MRRASILLVMIAALPAQADEWDLKTPSGKLEQSLKASGTRIQGLPAYEQRIEGLVESSVSYGGYGAKVAPWAWTWLREGAGKPTQPRLELREAWVERASDHWDLRLGNQILSWGAADQINPTDVWNPRDLTDPLASTKLPITVAQVRVHPMALENFSLEVDFTPFHRDPRLPFALPESGVSALSLNESRWLLPVPVYVSAGEMMAPLRYQVSTPAYPQSWQAGARLSMLRLAGWDFSASFYEGVEAMPRFGFTRKGVATDPALPVILTLHPSFHRTRMAGVDGAGAWGDVGLRFEAAYFRPDNSRASVPELWRGDTLHAVAGADYTFQRKLLGAVIYANLQYVRYQTMGDNPQPAVATLEGLPNTRAWDDNVVLYAESRFGSKFKVGNSLIASLRNGDGIIAPSVHYKLMDGLKASLGAELLVGSAAGFFGQMRDNSRATLGATYSF